MDLKVVWDVCVAVVAAQRRSERYVVPSTLLCRWNVTLPRFDGEDQGGGKLSRVARGAVFRHCWRQVCNHVHVLLDYDKNYIYRCFALAAK